MKLTQSDFVLMRWNILAFCGSLAISATILHLSGRYAEIAQKDRGAAQRQLDEARKRLSTAHEDQKNMAIYSDEYRTLLEHKVIGDNHRLDWIEGLESIRNKDVVIDFRYSIAPQKVFAPQPPVDTGNFDLHYSEMKLQLDLLHEGQLLDFFNALRQQVSGKYLLEGCTLKRRSASESSQAAGTVPNLKAECIGGWITLKNRNASQ